jgi:hypothetical protein
MSMFINFITQSHLLRQSSHLEEWTLLHVVFVPVDFAVHAESFGLFLLGLDALRELKGLEDELVWVVLGHGFTDDVGIVDFIGF